MTTIDPPSPHETSTSAASSRPASVDAAPRPSAQLILDAVVASYIHDISERHRQPQTASDPIGVGGR
jgi:hypothetical protein